MNQKGSAMVLSVVMLPVLLGFLGLAVDVGNVYLQKAKLQNTADAATWAGGQALPSTVTAEACARNYVAANKENPANAAVSFSAANTRIKVSLTKVVPTYFVLLLNIPSVTIKASAEAECIGALGPFGYAVFSGSTTDPLTVNGSCWKVEGSVHSNSDIELTGSGLQVSGTVSASGNNLFKGHSISYGYLESKVATIAMPDYTSGFAAEAASSGQVYSGDQAFVGNNLLDTTYVQGNAKVTGNLETSGALMADGNIEFDGTHSSLSDTDQFCFYSRNGDITVHCSSSTFNGVLYAPNGKITFIGSNCTINGSIVGKNVAFVGSGIVVNRSDYPPMAFLEVNLIN